MLADPTTGFLMGMSEYGQYQQFPIGGTSVASPLFAGVMALAQQKAGRHLGFSNPQFYKARKKAFRDIVPGTSLQAVAVPGGGVVTTFDYPDLTIHTAVGYDNVTGLGVPAGQAFLNAIE